MKLKRTIYALLPLLASQLTINAAEDGKLIFGQLCSACHGAEGQGVGGNVFPPLAGSEWVKGDPNRIAQILLHGLTGEIAVKGEVYNLAMPAQGSLSDEAKVAVIRYVKKEFAGEETDFSISDLEKAKKAHATRTTEWTAKELLELFPFPKEESPIKNLLMEIYDGQWADLPDFSQAKANAVEEEHDGFISLKNINKKDNFGLVWKGDLEVPQDGMYQFVLMADDGGAVFIDDKEVCRVKGLGGFSPDRAGKGDVQLTKGNHKIKVQYFQGQGEKKISLTWADISPNAANKTVKYLSAEQAANKRPAVVIDLTPTDGKARMYNNFIQDSTHRTMGVGFPHGHNIAFSTQDCQPDLIWKGHFINAGKHWTDRGQGTQVPLSNEVVKLGQGTAWSLDGKMLNLKLKGYTMDKQGNPTFSYIDKDTSMVFTEQYIPSEKNLTRTITINSAKDSALKLRLAKGQPVLSGQNATIENKLLINAPSMTVAEGELSTLFEAKKGMNTFKVIYSWTN